MKTSRLSVSKILILPDVVLSISTDLTFVSIGLASVPNPVTTSATSLPVVASISRDAFVSPSNTPPLVEVSVTAVSEELVVSSRPRVMSSSAERARVPEPASNTVPSTMARVPPAPLLSESLSAVTVMLPVVVVKSPESVKIMSSSASRLIEPPADSVPVTFRELSPPTVTARSPATVEVERVIVLLLVNVALPEVPEVFKLTAPVNEFDVLSRVIA